MGKVIGWVFLIFFGLVALNYVFVSASNFLTGGGFAHAQLTDLAPYNSTFPGLASIDFNFFNASGTGKDYITQGYGRTSFAYVYLHDWHNGIDLAANFGTPVYSPAAGTVLAVVNQDAYCPRIAYGKYVALDDPVNHLVLVFSHLGEFAVSEGEHIPKGTLIGTVGPTGLETGPHLLVSIFKEKGFDTSPAHGCGPYPQGQDVNPLNYLGTVYK